MTRLKNILTSPPKEYSKKECNKELTEFHKKLFELQNIFYADGRFELLIIFKILIHQEKTELFAI